jgi:hypothetical protein
MNYDEQLAALRSGQDAILAGQAAIDKRLAAIEEKLPVNITITTPAPEPSEAGGLYDFVRPPADEPPYGLGIAMTSVDVGEAINRACHGVNWRGDIVLSPAMLDEVWTEIEALKAGDVALIAKYRNLDPGFAGLALLTGLTDPAKYDGFIGQAKRDAWAGTTVQSFIDGQFTIDGTPGIAGE